MLADEDCPLASPPAQHHAVMPKHHCTSQQTWCLLSTDRAGSGNTEKLAGILAPLRDIDGAPRCRASHCVTKEPIKQ